MVVAKHAEYKELHIVPKKNLWVICAPHRPRILKIPWQINGIYLLLIQIRHSHLNLRYLKRGAAIVSKSK